MTRIEALTHWAADQCGCGTCDLCDRAPEIETIVRLAYWYGQMACDWRHHDTPLPPDLDEVHSYVEERADTDGP